MKSGYETEQSEVEGARMFTGVPVCSSGWMMGFLLAQEMLAKPTFGGRSGVLACNVEFEAPRDGVWEAYTAQGGGWG